MSDTEKKDIKPEISDISFKKPRVEDKSTADSKIAEQETAKQRIFPDLNLKGVKVDIVDEKPLEQVKVFESEQKAPEVKMPEPAEKKISQETRAISKSQLDDVLKKSAKKDESDKTRILTGEAKKAVTDNKTYIMPTENQRPAPKKKKKQQQSFNYTIFGGFFLAFGVVVVAFIVALSGISLGKEYLGIDKPENDITFNIPQGSTSADIADLLEENLIIENKLLFRLALKLNAPPTIYPGDITLQPSMGYSAVIQQLGTMRESYETATISFPEGVTLLEVAQMLEKENVCKADDFLFEFNKDQGYDFEKLITDNDDAFYQMEGYLFPDTYEFYVGDKGYNITKTVRDHFSQKFTPKMIEKMKKRNLTMNQVITLASMVQWEANSVDDMPKVASVFLNRWNDQDTFPSFQSDATEKYIDKVIKTEADTKAELEHYTEGYDTYNCRGLPAGPICNPGLDAINAVLDPENTDYYYFCNNLKTGESFFAKTLDEHEENLIKAGLKK